VVARVRARMGPKPTLIGVGGIETADDARRMREAGADLLQIYTSFIYQGPEVIATLRKGVAQAQATRTPNPHP
jgi:dihydroorotate dehydrogenase